MSSLRGLNKYIIEQMNYSVLSFPNLSIYPNKTCNDLHYKKNVIFCLKHLKIYGLSFTKTKI